jgi:hypothetical protein
MKVVQFFKEHNFHVDWHFQFGEEKGEKLSQRPTASVYRNRATFKVWLQFVQNLLRKIPYGLCERCRG